MKTKILIYYLFCTSFLYISATAQKVTQQVFSSYPAAVIVKVYDILQKVPLNEEKQVKLATLFQREDSLMVTAFKAKAAYTALAEIKKQSLQEFQKLLTQSELQKYYTASAMEPAQRLAAAEATAISTNLKTGAQNEKFLYKTYLNKYLEIDRIRQQYQFDSTQNARLVAVIAHFDSISHGQVMSFKIKKYFTEQIAFLDSVKPLTKAQKGQLEKLFSGLSIKTTSESFSQNFKTAMHSALKDTVYYRAMYSSEIQKRATFNSNRYVGKYIREYKLGKESKDRLTPLMYEKEKQLAVIDQAFPFYTSQKDSMIYATTTRFDSLIIRALCYDGINAPDTWFFRVLRDKKSLRLSATQVDSLAEKGFELEYNRKAKADGRKEYADFDIRKFEREQMPKILSEEQYLKFLTAQNKEEAAKYTLKNWNEVKQYGWVQATDSARVYKQIENYNLARSIAIDRYRNDKVSRYQNLAAIDLSIPPVMQKLKAANKRAKISAEMGKKEEELKINQGTFQW